MEERASREFFAAAAAAERIADPMARCIAYPDPPGAHWNRASFGLYCRYLFEPVMPMQEIADLVRNGRAAELDQRLQRARAADATHAGTPELLDRIYFRNFWHAPTPVERRTVDAWKRQSPKSAYAWAASGTQYVEAAQQARGGAYASETPARRFLAMNAQLKRARSDLAQAVALDPTLIPAYSAMVYVGGLSDGASGLEAARRALAIDPASLSIHAQWMWLSDPRWHGSIDAMRRVAEAARAHADANPLLLTLRSDPDAAAAGIDICDCTHEVLPEGYAAVLDQGAGKGIVVAAAKSVLQRPMPGGNPAPSAILLSEALRFAPDDRALRLGRVELLFESGQAAFARSEVDGIVAASPGDAQALSARAWLLLRLRDWPASERDFLASLRIKPDPSTLARLGHLYVDAMHDWDKGWDVAQRLVKGDPRNPEGWLLTWRIQKAQPRLGARATAAYFLAHFGDRLQWSDDIDTMREEVAVRQSGDNPPARP